MNNKASIDMDWVISIALFLLYVIFLFAFLKPIPSSATQEGKILLDILQEQLNLELNNNITKTPIYIYCESCNESKSGICTNVFPYEWDKENLELLDESSNSVSLDDGCKFGFNDELTRGMNLYNLIYAKDYLRKTQPEDCANLCVTPVTMHYGLTQSIHGYSLSKLAGLNSTTYNLIKSNWAYPRGNDFKITIKANDGSIILLIGKEPNLSDNIYARQFTANILKEDTSRETIVVNINAW